MATKKNKSAGTMHKSAKTNKTTAKRVVTPPSVRQKAKNSKKAAAVITPAAPVISDKVKAKTPKTRKKTGRLAVFLGILVAIAMIVTGVILCLSTDKIPEEEVAEEVEITEPVEEEPEEPEEEVVAAVAVDWGQQGIRFREANKAPTPSQTQGYVVAANKPRYLSIPSLGIYNALILEVGLTAQGNLAVPVNPAHIGWYVGSKLPGTNQVSLMEGHGGDLGIGIFKNLPRIAYGAEIIIEMGDGRRYTYVVADKVSKAIGAEANNYMPTAFTSPEPGRGSLTLITCTGAWIRAQQTYDHRLFVRALLK